MHTIFEGLGSRSQFKIVEVNMHSLMANYAVFLNVENVAVYVLYFYYYYSL